jgi:hypothetical protein
VRTKHSLPDDWWSQDLGPAETAGAHWEIGWDDELASFYARLVMDYQPGELGEGLDPEGEVVAFSYGERPGALRDPLRPCFRETRYLTASATWQATWRSE